MKHSHIKLYWVYKYYAYALNLINSQDLQYFQFKYIIHSRLEGLPFLSLRFAYRYFSLISEGLNGL